MGAMQITQCAHCYPVDMESDSKFQVHWREIKTAGDPMSNELTANTPGFEHDPISKLTQPSFEELTGSD